MSKVKIKILLTDRLGDLQTEDLADCGFNAGDVVFAHMHEDGTAEVIMNLSPLGMKVFICYSFSGCCRCGYYGWFQDMSFSNSCYNRNSF